MSTASATLLAPSAPRLSRTSCATVAPGMSDQQPRCKAPCASACWCLPLCVLVYAITMQGTSIYELVSGAYQVPLVGAFVPLVFGLYWKRATTQGAFCRCGAGFGVWVIVHLTPGLGTRRKFPAAAGRPVGRL
jgi:SSS family solute:Na+ symporter